MKKGRGFLETAQLGILIGLYAVALPLAWQVEHTPEGCTVALG